MRRLFFLLVVLTPLTAGAWGRRGHQIVAENAALLVSGEPNGEFMRAHSFDMAYYANVPDFIWKRPSTYDIERPQHYMDLEIFDRAFPKHPDIAKPYELSRKDFESKFPEIKPEAGRAYWRIRELFAQAERITNIIKDMKEQTGPARQKLQEQWILLNGVMAHYVGDLSMPMHVTENHDGQLSDQRGLHSYFEDLCVDQLYPALDNDVNKKAAAKWPAFTKSNKNKTVLELLEQLTDHSKRELPKLLALDKKIGRADVKKAAQAYKPMIEQQLVDSVLTLAELYRRHVGWNFDDHRFYFFSGEPEYMKPGENP